MRGFMDVVCNNMAKMGSDMRLSRFSVENLTIYINGKTLKKYNIVRTKNNTEVRSLRQL